jgi:hypothetical protein
MGAGSATWPQRGLMRRLTVLLGVLAEHLLLSHRDIASEAFQQLLAVLRLVVPIFAGLMSRVIFEHQRELGL